MRPSFRRIIGILLCLPLARTAAAGYSIQSPGRAAVPVRSLEGGPGSEWLGLSEAMAYLGGSCVWRPETGLLDLQLGDAKATLMLEESWAYMDAKRVRLPGIFTLLDGSPVLDKRSLEAVFKGLGAVATLKREQPGPSPSRTAAAGRDELLRRIVIDPGHGGKDPGARGSGGLTEKETCLDIALRLRDLLKKKMPSVEVILTRSDDSFPSLRDRIIIANKADADLFISIHNNASRNRQGRGSQVFFYDSMSSDKAAEDLALQENQEANVLEILLQDLGKTGRVKDQSISLGQHVQDELRSDLGLRKRNLSCAPFYVLARTKMPAILVEVAFITNPQEAKLLKSTAFRNQVAEGICRGISQFQTETALR